MSSQAFGAEGHEPIRPAQVDDLAELRPPAAEPLSPEQLAELQDAERQAEYQRQFLIQQSRRACPGCGDW
jgi:hypothetical protein